ncbi:hypothetical protein OSH04_01930 [Alcaligenes sp. A-TC2]|uniref:hypothetical protein n=1 Tax=Alcaligenes nematophilus TaxID=2994643 RepID=UPI0022500E6B|nr:hypothetical protein [Alcaligenes nematophilus]MCX5470468.1 hypothetical protein [Alcaligenes nematophilus]
MENAYISSFDDQGRYVASIWGHPLYVLAPSAQAWPHHTADGRFDESWWFNGMEVVKRQACPATVEGAVLLDVPPDSKILIEGVSYECIDGGEVELSFDQPGSYEVKVICWPYLEGVYIVENPPSVK